LACVFFTVLYKLLTLNPVIIKGLSIRLGHVTLAISARFSGAASLASEKPLTDGTQSERQIGRLVSIAALPEVRGRNISAKLLFFFEEQLKKRGTNEVRLCVNADNGRAIQFYKKSGWQRIKDNGNELEFSKDLQ
jgi:ribosomal protein S18 acetylase RimI-like enzyme